MSTTRQIALGAALLAALALAAVWGVGAATPPLGATATALTSDRDTDSGRPPTTGPTNPAGYRA